jgi:hypothetical protein
MKSCSFRPICRLAAAAALLCSVHALAQNAVGGPRPDGDILPPANGNVQSVPAGPDVFIPGPGNDDHLVQRPPNLENVPPVPMGLGGNFNGRADDSVIVHDSTNNQTWQVPTVPGGAPSGQGGGYTGADGFVVPPEMARNFGSMSNACCLTSFPASANVRLLMRFVNDQNASFYYVCSGAMQDAGMVMCAAHCVYWNTATSGLLGGRPPGNGGWVAEIWVYPGWDGNGASPPGTTTVIQNFGFSHSTFFGAGTDYINNGNWDADFGIVMAGHGGERHVGMLTGWYGWAYGFDCATIQSRTYYNYSFPAENSGCCPSGHDGATMKFWGGTWDACPSNQLQLFTTCGCDTAVWGGMSGSNAYYIDNGGRYAHAVCSTSNRSTRGQYCKMWQGWSDFMEGQRTNTRGGTFDLEGFRYRLTGSTTIQATTNTSTAQFLASNISNADPGSRTFTYRVYLSTNDIISSGDTQIGAATYTYTFDYAPMQNVTVNVPAVTIPNVAPGTYWLGAILDSGSDAFSGNNDTSLWDAQQITVTSGPPGAPANNLCASATSYAIGNSVNGSTSNATTDGSATCGASTASPDVWYSFTAPSCGVVHFDTCGSLYDTVISLHTACPGTTGNQLACNDDNGNGGNNACGGGLQSGFDVSVTAGTTYKLRVSGFNGLSGNFVLNSFYVNPANDDCPTATAYAAGSTINGCMGGASNDGSATCGASGTSGDVWFRLVPSTSGLLRINTCGSGFDTVLSVHTGCPGTTANQIACNDDSGAGPCVGTLQSCVDVGVVAGSAYYIRIAGFAGSIGNGLYTLSSGFITPPNDTCAGVINYNIGTSITGVNAGAGVEGSATCGSSNSTPDVWYRIVGTCGGLLNINTCGSSFDTVLSIHSACPGTTANQVACNDDGFIAGCGIRDSNITFTATSGATYYVRVSGFSGNTGVFRLNSAYVTAGSDDCDLAPTITDGSYTVGNCGATTDGPQENGCSFCCGDAQVNNDLWFRYVASQCGTVTVTTCGNTGFDTKLAAYNGGCPFGDDTAIACNDDAGCSPLGTLSRMSFSVNRGATYTIRFGGFSTARGTAIMQVSSVGRCGSPDFDCDGDIGTDFDIQSFFACLGGNCPPAPCCASADFDGDGDVGTDADIEAFFRVLAGGAC